MHALFVICQLQAILAALCEHLSAILWRRRQCLGESTYAALLEMTLLHDNSSSSSDTEPSAALLPLLLERSTAVTSYSTSATAAATTPAAVERCDTGASLALLLRLLPELPLAVQCRARRDLSLLLQLPRMRSAVHSVLSQSCATDPAGSWQQCILQLLHRCYSSSSAASAQSHSDGSSVLNTVNAAAEGITGAAAEGTTTTECSTDAQCEELKTLLKLYAELLAHSAFLSDAGCAELDLAVALQCMQPQQSAHDFLKQLLAEVAVELHLLHEVS
jgi:hypothetical protein